MKKALLLVLLFSIAIAGSALEKNDFSYLIENNPRSLDVEYSKVNLALRLEPKVKNPAFNVTLKLKNTLETQSKEETKSIPSLKLMHNVIIEWQLKATEAGTYDLSNAFEVVSWDDSVSLQVDAYPENSNQKIITISGWTDTATLCEKHNYSGFWGEQENCQVKLTANGKEYWAERSGVYSFTYELEKGENRIDLHAMDPGGNTNEQVLMITYTPSIMNTMQEYIVWILGIVIVLGIIAAILISKFVLNKSEQIATKTYEEHSLDELKEKQTKMFQTLIINSSKAGGFHKQTALELIELFKTIIKKDEYYYQNFPDNTLAIKEHETIFNNQAEHGVVKKILLELYSKALQEHQHKLTQ